MDRILQEAAAKSGLSVEELLRMTGLVADQGRAGSGQPPRPGNGESHRWGERNGGGREMPPLSSVSSYLPSYGAAPSAPSAQVGASGWEREGAPEQTPRKRPLPTSSGQQLPLFPGGADNGPQVKHESDLPPGGYLAPSSSPLSRDNSQPQSTSHCAHDGFKRRAHNRPESAAKGSPGLGLDLNLGLPADEGAPSSINHKDSHQPPALAAAAPSEHSWPGLPSGSAQASEQRPLGEGGLLRSIFPAQSGATGTTDSYDSRHAFRGEAPAPPQHTHSLQLGAQGPKLMIDPRAQQALDAALASSQLSPAQLQALLLAALPGASRGSGPTQGAPAPQAVPSASLLSGDASLPHPEALPRTPTDSHRRHQQHFRGSQNPGEDPCSTPVARAQEPQGLRSQGPRGSQSSKRSGDSWGGGGKGSAGGGSLGARRFREGPEEEDEILGKDFGSDEEEGSLSGDGEDADGFHLDESTFKLGSSVRKIALEKKRRHQLSSLLRQLKRVTGGCGTKVEVVQRAIESIRSLKTKVAELETRVADLEGQLMAGGSDRKRVDRSG